MYVMMIRESTQYSKIYINNLNKNIYGAHTATCRVMHLCLKNTIND